jgi:hypothetical protein
MDKTLIRYLKFEDIRFYNLSVYHYNLHDKQGCIITGCRGRCAPSTIAADVHPQAARRFAPHNQRMHLAAPVHDPFGLIPGLAGDPQRLVA